jgi:hypothetical protein
MAYPLFRLTEPILIHGPLLIKSRALGLDFGHGLKGCLNELDLIVSD